MIDHTSVLTSFTPGLSSLADPAQSLSVTQSVTQSIPSWTTASSWSTASWPLVTDTIQQGIHQPALWQPDTLMPLIPQLGSNFPVVFAAGPFSLFQHLQSIQSSLSEHEKTVLTIVILMMAVGMVIHGSNLYAREEQFKNEAETLKKNLQGHSSQSEVIEILERQAASDGLTAATMMAASGAGLTIAAAASGEPLYAFPQMVLTATSMRTLLSRFFPEGPLQNGLSRLELPFMLGAALSIPAVFGTYGEAPLDILVPASLGTFGVAFSLDLNKGGWREGFFRSAMMLAGLGMTLGAGLDIAFTFGQQATQNLPALALYAASFGMNGYLAANEVPYFKKWWNQS